MWASQGPTTWTSGSPVAAAGLSFSDTPWADGPAERRVTATPVESWSVDPVGSPDPVTGETCTFDQGLRATPRACRGC